VLFHRVLLPLISLHVCGAIGAQSPSDAGQTSLSLQDGLAWVEIQTPLRKEPLHFVVDTGAGVTVLDRRVADELNLRKGRRVIVTGTQGNTTARMVAGFHGELVGARLPSTLLALDLGNISRWCERRIDGLLGADFLNGRTVQLDFKAGALRIGSACHSPSSRAAKLVLKKRNDAWCTVAEINSSPSNWLRIDTGFDGKLGWCPTAVNQRRDARGTTVALKTSSSSEVVSRLSFPRLTLPQVDTTLLSRPPFNRESGLIGLGLLSQFRLTFNVDEGHLYLEAAER